MNQKEKFLNYFVGLFSSKKLPLNLIGGFVFVSFVIMLNSSNYINKDIYLVKLVFSFIVGFIYVNFLVLETRKIFLRDVIRFIIPLALLFWVIVLFI
jgi:hypothetical protein